MVAVVENSYGPNDYFAFVESKDPHSADVDFGKADASRTPWDALLLHRRKEDLGPPDIVIWLDCVRASYFMNLDWLQEPCEIGNAEHAARRRERIGSLEDSEFRVALLLIDSRSEEEFKELRAYTEEAWHLVSIDTQGILPAMTAPDYDLDVGTSTLRYIQHKRFTEKGESSALLNVFSLNFLPDADFRRREFPDKTPSPGGTPPRSDKGAKSKTTWEYYEQAERYDYGDGG